MGLKSITCGAAAGLDWFDELAELPLSFFSITHKKDRVIPTWVAIAHLFNHQTHHRGQVTTLLKQLGKDPGVTDLPWMPYFDPARE
jgi:uncharacterized damage-inducible protein DinB